MTVQFAPPLRPARTRLTIGRSTLFQNLISAAAGLAKRGSPSAVERCLSTEFDAQFYLQRYPDLPPDIDPLRHYVSIGWREGRDPCSWFSTSKYLELYPDVKASGVNPFYHFLQFGRRENRTVAPSFSSGALTFVPESHAPGANGWTGMPPASGAPARTRGFFASLFDAPRHIEKPETVLGAIDFGFPLGDAGLLIFGWHFSPQRAPTAIYVCDERGNKAAVGDRMTPLARPDVANGYRPRFPDVEETCGFVCLAPMPTDPGDSRALCFDFGEVGTICLRVPTDVPSASGPKLARMLLSCVPVPGSDNRERLHEILDSGLGQAVEAVNLAGAAPPSKIDVRQYGSPPANPAVTVLVPLRSRFDFIRYQLAHFAGDADFKQVDLIYIVDDPRTISSVHELAGRYHPLFQVPFRVISYKESQGFAGASNIGAQFAQSDVLVLLHPDVLAQRHGWLSALRSALDDLPEAGAVAPLLQFGDGSIQHAGAQLRTDTHWPGFSLVAHPQKGMSWFGGEAPSEQPLLSAACLMLRTRDFVDFGGLDEGYLSGNFEDYDLCLGLQKRGRRLWLLPGIQLWHLDVDDWLVSHDQIATLFNAWRWGRKIRNGDLIDPNLEHRS